MVSKILQFLNREVGAVNQAALLLGLFTLLSQILGLIRDRAFTSTIGAGRELDVYYTAFQVPDLLFNLVATLVSVTVLLPILLKIIQEKGDTKAYDIFSQIFTAFFVLVIVVSLIAFFAIPYLSPVIAPGFDAQQLKDLVMLSRIILISPILLGVSNLFGSVTQMHKRFVLFSIAPVLYNLGILLGIVWLYPWFGLKGLAYGVVLGALLHALIQVPALIQSKMLPRFHVVRDWIALRSLAYISLPRTLGLTLHSVTLLVLVSVATTVGEGSVSIFRLSMNLQNVPLALVGASFSVAAFPTLAKNFTDGKTKEFIGHIANASRQIIFWSLPITVLFIVLRAQIVRVILGSQNFSWDDTRLAAAALALFVISVTAQSLILLFTRAFYATGDTKRPVMINFVSSVCIIVLAFLFMHVYQINPALHTFLVGVLRITGVVGVEVVLLALAYSVGSFVNAIVLVHVFKNIHNQHKTLGISKTIFDTVFVSLVMGLTAYVFLNILDGVFLLSTFGGVFAQGFFSGLIAIGVGVWMLYLLDNQEFFAVQNALKRKFKTTPTVSVAHEDIG